MSDPVLFKDRAEWRRWLGKNHDKESEVWVVYYKAGVKKKDPSKKSVEYNDAVEEALCFGWIDSMVRRIDDEKHMQRFTPRHKKSNWSASNKARVERLIAEKRMTEAGLRVIEAARENGSWNNLDGVDDGPGTTPGIPKGLQRALGRDTKIKENFEKLPPSRQKQYIWWVVEAKQEKTRQKRIDEIIKRLG